MKKQEAIEKLQSEAVNHYSETSGWFKEIKLDIVTDIVNQIYEPKKAVVPRYIDTWIQGAEYNGFDLYEAMTDETPDKVSTWIVCNPETFAKAWIYGYEVEKEKLYTVKFSNEDFGKTYIGIIKTANKIGISTVPINDECSKCYFTKSELEEFKFWNNPAFEIKEVTE
ncbi:DUF1642 domain-containing protein [Streptococcus pasteurianus]|uniref:DUF1642 domain-containing protein n=1 Tax=Streptococcus pasteurianus TaxID=197614 RepID=UPI000660D3CE|nr:DUF1642 domain-containing protein [Streptococcus pasteurianus]QBX27732.1 hypothetical protein Javan414_0029 [Streptococcus phage Javan414]